MIFRRRRRDPAGVIRHTEETDAAPAAADPELIAAVGAHFERHFGPHKVFHPDEAMWVPVDILVSEPQPWRTLVTCGMTPEDFSPLVVGERTIEFLALFPLYEREMDFKLAEGLEALVDRLDEAEATEVVEPRRPSVA